jgi:hypothetical protein
MSFNILLLRVRCAYSLPAILGLWPRIARDAALSAAIIVQSVGLLVYIFSYVWFDRILSLVEYFFLNNIKVFPVINRNYSGLS